MKTKQSLGPSLDVLGALVAINLFAATSYGQSWSDEFASPNPNAPPGIVEGNGGDGALRVLLVVANVADNYATIRSGLAALPEIGQLDTFNSQLGTPTLDQLLNYSCVVVWAEFSHLDPDALGNNLADYVDSGGGVIASTPSRIIGSWWIGGRFLSGGYDPMTNGSGPQPPSTLGTFDPSHPAMTTPYPINNLFGDARESTSLRPDVEDVARWADNLPLLAIKGYVAGNTAYLHDGGFWSGQFPELLVNTCLYLTRCRGGDQPPTSN